MSAETLDVSSTPFETVDPNRIAVSETSCGQHLDDRGIGTEHPGDLLAEVIV